MATEAVALKYPNDLVIEHYLGGDRFVRGGLTRRPKDNH
jgi:hypothetical protein